MGNERSIGKGFAVLSMASMLVKVMSLLFVPLMLNLLGEEGYGVYSITYQIFSFIYIIANSGVPVAISKHVSELSERKYHGAALRSFKISRSFLIAIGLLLSILMAALCTVLANAMHTPKAWAGILALAPCVLLTAVLSAYRGYFQGRQQMNPTAVTQVLEQLVHIVFSVGLALLASKSIELGVAGASVGTSIGALVALVAIVMMFNRYVSTGFASPGDNLRSPYTYKDLAMTILKYSIPITICSAVQHGGNLIDAWNTKGRLIVSGLLESDASIWYGYLAKSQQLINVPVSLVTALSVAMMVNFAITAYAAPSRNAGTTKFLSEVALIEAKDQAEADKNIAQARAEERRAMAVALEQEMKAKAQEARARVIEAEAEVPLAMAEAFRTGNLGIMDYYRMKNMQAETEMRENIAKQ